LSFKELPWDEALSVFTLDLELPLKNDLPEEKELDLLLEEDLGFFDEEPENPFFTRPSLLWCI